MNVAAGIDIITKSDKVLCKRELLSFFKKKTKKLLKNI
jgi:hypothetical protein